MGYVAHGLELPLFATGDSAKPRSATRRLKICFISETVQAGVGRHLMDATIALSDRGHEIHLIYSPARTAPEFLAAIAAQPNVSCHPVYMTRAIGTRDATTFAKILTYVRAHGPFDIVHGHSSKGGGYARLLKLFGHGRICYSPHAFVTMSPRLTTAKRIFYTGIERLLAGMTDRVICTSSRERDHARELGLAINRLELIVNATAEYPAPPREEIRKQLGLRSDQIVLGFAGRLEEQKAPERVLEVARRLLPELPNLVLVMVGGGAQRDAMRDSMIAAGLGDRVRWLGPVDARQYLPSFDIFVLPSRYEGCAYVLLEALHAGLPIVSTPVGGTDETVLPGINGFLVAHEPSQEMGAAIRLLATEPALRQSMADASRAHAKRFTVDRMVTAMETLYLDIARESEARDDLSELLPALR